MRKIVLSLVLISMLAFFIGPASLAKTFSSQSISDVKKSWTIKFSQPVDSASLNSNYVYITKGSQKISTGLKLLDGGYTVEVTPLVPYEPGQSYRLVVSESLKSVKGQALKESVSKPFDVLDPAAAIQSIQYTTGEGIHSFKVKARNDVYAVKINGVDLHLTGWNEFSHTFLNLKPGTTVTIRAYSSTNKVLETKTLTVGE
ncbi:Ig-like domain-containing protein [Bacillus sp. OxB-1]|uniref:Ig-like domain-containing protein n=1 Tax=Bacillus sp. (strain OxB-1) TaxID=98228 RepID=UPI001E382325|nr:Ig-like domain-containing protein [Bacillus sp. OxB-1]